MVFQYKSRDGQYLIYMGRDKYENEDLIKYGFDDDIWFHVDDMSSAHVYLRMRRGETMDDIPPNVLDDCCQLVKANSIEGCKKNNISIIYTPWSNLNKTKNMETGAIGFHDRKLVRSVKVEKKNNDVLKPVEKTKSADLTPDFAGERERYDRDIVREQKEEKKRQLAAQKQAEAERIEREKQLHYTDVMCEDNMKTNKYDDNVNFRDIEDDFM
eukprot:GFYU01007622.1.p1 GENE.GFYU01007622.1~~GFYU01007622.1.p1  ORF type:complete len:213 (-),score=75.62 GFYU01007622.1:39-677(-)